jgi:Ca2+/Na+ antiporter
MYTARRLIGALIIILLGVPLLCAMIWAVGFTRAAVSPEMISELPQSIATEVPRLVDDALAAAAAESGIKENSRLWLKAIADARISVTDLMMETGVTPWMKTEMTESFRTVARMLKGETEPRPVLLNLRPLKLAIQHPAVDRSLNQVLAKLPPCDALQIESWERIAAAPDTHDNLPPCQPNAAVATAALQGARVDLIRGIPDEIELLQFDSVRFSHPRTNLHGALVSLAYFLFVIPGIFILLGALLAAKSKSSFFRWSGISTLIGGLISLGFATLLGRAASWAIAFAPYHRHVSEGGSRLPPFFVEHLESLFSVIGKFFFSPVISVSEAVCVIGLILVALSFAFTTDHQTPAQADPTKTPS